MVAIPAKALKAKYTNYQITTFNCEFLGGSGGFFTLINVANFFVLHPLRRLKKKLQHNSVSFKLWMTPTPLDCCNMSLSASSALEKPLQDLDTADQ